MVGSWRQRIDVGPPSIILHSCVFDDAGQVVNRVVLSVKCFKYVVHTVAFRRLSFQVRLPLVTLLVFEEHTRLQMA